MQRVWANGSPLVPTLYFGAPIWIGPIPADDRPGPQTVYFLGEDQQGGPATYIADYEVVSGGTNFSLAEVADPVVKVAKAGVALDVRIARAETTISMGSSPVLAKPLFTVKLDGVKVPLANRLGGDEGHAQQRLDGAVVEARSIVLARRAPEIVE